MAIFSTVLTAALLFCSRIHAAAVITYEAINLADPVQGADLWQYTYRISDFTFGLDQGFSIFFSPNLYRNLQDPPPAPNGDWDVISLQPDVALSSSGIYDGRALTNGASLGDSFTIEFIWLGAGTPGAQPFEIYDSNFSVLQQGTTVPEPTTAGLLILGTLAVVGCLRQRRSVQSKSNSPPS